jgi:thiosulfate dehydrogenase [quinone] large subunit
MTSNNPFLARGVVQDHPIEVQLFHSTGLITVFWLLVRLWLGWQWLTAGWDKIQNPNWMNGKGLAGFWQGAIANSTSDHPALAFGWYADFLRNLAAGHAETWFAPLVAYAEVLVGICLILGLFTGIAAALGAFMNFNFMLAGSAGVNPVFFLFALLLLMAWKNAGWIGLDRFVLPKLGTPWHAGEFFHPVPPGPRSMSPEA